jgi:hypothetical protein
MYKNQLSQQAGSRNLTGPKTLPTIWHTYMKLVTKYQIPAINSCWEKCDEKWAYMFNVYKNQHIVWEAFLIPSDSYFLFADLVGFSTHWTYMHIFRHIFLSNYWWQESDIWSQASYRYAILWEAFLDPSDSYFLFADLVGFYTHWTYMLIFRRIFLSNYWWQESDIWSQASYMYAILWEAFLDPSDSYFLFASCWEKCDEKWAYMFNVYKNQQSRQTGIRNLMGPKMLPMIWGTYMKLVTKYQISAINSCWE